MLEFPSTKCVVFSKYSRAMPPDKYLIQRRNRLRKLYNHWTGPKAVDPRGPERVKLVRVKILAITLLWAGAAWASCGDELTRTAAVEILIRQCGSCHRGPWLDFSKYPFLSDRYPKEAVLIEDSIRRMKEEGFKRMPPVNFAPVPPHEIEAVEAWLKTL